MTVRGRGSSASPEKALKEDRFEIPIFSLGLFILRYVARAILTRWLLAQRLLVLLIRILNAGLPDSGLALHLSEATAGSLSGIGHSTAYEEAGVYEYVEDASKPLGVRFQINSQK